MYYNVVVIVKTKRTPEIPNAFYFLLSFHINLSLLIPRITATFPRCVASYPFRVYSPIHLPFID